MKKRFLVSVLTIGIGTFFLAPGQKNDGVSIGGGIHATLDLAEGPKATLTERVEYEALKAIYRTNPGNTLGSGLQSGRYRNHHFRVGL